MSAFFRHTSLRRILLISVVFQIVLAVGLTGGLSFYYGRQAVLTLIDNLHAEVTRRVHMQLGVYLSVPPQINALNADAIQHGDITPENRAAIERRLWRQANQFDTVSYIGLTFTNGLYVGAKQKIVEIRDASTDNMRETWTTNGQGQRLNRQSKPKPYDPLQRPWFLQAQAAQKPVWSEVYTYSNSNARGLSANTPVFDNDGELVAVLSTDLTLDRIEEFLHELEIKEGDDTHVRKSIFLVDCKGQPIRDITRPERKSLFNAALNELYENQNVKPTCDANMPSEAVNHHFIHNNQAYLIQLSRHTGTFEPALNWWVLVIAPIERYVRPVVLSLWWIGGILLICTLLAILLVVITARRIVQPIDQLNQAAHALANGNWNHNLSLERRDEIGLLAQNFKRMAWQIEESFHQMEDKVQARTQDLADRNKELNHLNQQLIQLNQDKSEFLSIIAHDLKNPLGSIQSITDLLRYTLDDCDTEELLDNLDMIEISAAQMFELVGKLLDADALEGGRMPLKISSMAVMPIFEKLLEHYQALAARKNISLQLETDTDYSVLADALALQRVFDNLLSNAVKYSPADTHVSIKILTEDGNVRFEIQDQGPGLSEEDQTKLFGKYHRLSAKPTGGEHSTGLGLFIVKQLVDSMNGQIWCESEIGKGATFVMVLPSAVD